MRCVVGNGNSISAWVDPWLPTHPPRAPTPKNAEVQQCLIKDWFNPIGPGWNESVIRDLVSEEDIPLVLATRLLSTSRKRHDRMALQQERHIFWLNQHIGSQHIYRNPRL
ncbi:unnamed protein product [Microthlaspi erraticum]|uniref:Reverse transcriptase zinc-binding domain-containing protein n=1 Tax=Microthlaspi erraticum TaxID=1685480 RepID=A0A6D2JTK5_9BRAS|nr:unnamed protein product [Microthlaspi erraticum]